MSQILSKVEEQNIVKRYLEDTNLTIARLAREMNRNKYTVSSALKRNGIVIRRVRQLTEKEKEEIYKKYFEESVSLASLAKEYHVNSSSIYRFLKQFKDYEEKTESLKSFSEEIVREYFENDVTHAELAEKYKCARATITHIIKEAKISNPKYKTKKKSIAEQKKNPRRKLSITAEELINEKAKTGLSYSKLAKKYDVSESCIYHAIARYRGKWN